MILSDLKWESMKRGPSQISPTGREHEGKELIMSVKCLLCAVFVLHHTTYCAQQPSRGDTTVLSFLRKNGYRRCPPASPSSLLT